MLRTSLAQHIVKGIGGVVRRMVDEVLSQVGGVRDENIHLFDYPPLEVVRQIVLTGEVPEKVSHQFYSTPAELAKEFVEWVGLAEQGIYYETSAGTGGIAKHMPLQTFCIEVDRLRVIALDSMGFEVKHADFLALAPSDLGGAVDGCIMNPPFAGRAWQAHFEHAVQFVKEGGIIGAILPEGAPYKMPTVQGGEVVYSEPKKNRFPDTSISVVFAKWVKAVQSGAAPAEGSVRTVEGQLGLFQAA
jgi:predicted RNA methylase